MQVLDSDRTQRGLSKRWQMKSVELLYGTERWVLYKTHLVVYSTVYYVQYLLARDSSYDSTQSYPHLWGSLVSCKHRTRACSPQYRTCSWKQLLSILTLARDYKVLWNLVFFFPLIKILLLLLLLEGCTLGHLKFLCFSAFYCSRSLWKTFMFNQLKALRQTS